MLTLISHRDLRNAKVPDPALFKDKVFGVTATSGSEGPAGASGARQGKQGNVAVLQLTKLPKTLKFIENEIEDEDM